jgi:dipeptidyl aminopeptidase/acylaminoacyl peptidase
MAAFTIGVTMACLGVVVGGPAQPPRATDQKKGAGEPPAKENPFAPMVKIQDQDYARVRSEFRTKLTRKGPSPQKGSVSKVPAGVSEIEYVSGALRLRAWVNRPKTADPKRPAVLFLHGGFAFEAPDDWEVSQSYRDAGFIVLTPMLRGENGQPGAFSFYYDEVDDVLAAAEYLRKQPYVDGDRLYLAGPSAGGTLALLTAMTSKHFRAAASFSAMPDQVLFCKHAKGAARDVPTDITNLKELEVRSPLAYAASLKCPTRIYYGSKEPYLTATSKRTAEVAKGKGLDVEAVEVEGDHGTSVTPGIKQSIAFFRKN